jgi:hypothetical protein
MTTVTTAFRVSRQILCICISDVQDLYDVNDARFVRYVRYFCDVFGVLDVCDILMLVICIISIVPDRRCRTVPEVVLVRRWSVGVLGIWRGEGWGEGWDRRGQFTSNLRPR